MGVVLIALILGLALCIERIIYLNLATTDTDKLLADIDEALKGKKGMEGAKEVCRNTPGPVASIFYQGLERSSEGLDMVEKSIVASKSINESKMLEFEDLAFKKPGDGIPAKDYQKLLGKKKF